MQTVDIEAFVQGAVSIERGDGWVQPRRLPHEQAALFLSPENNLLTQAAACSGVRLRFETDSARIRLLIEPIGSHPLTPENRFDVTIAGELVASVPAEADGRGVTLDGLPAGPKTVEVWLPQSVPVRIRRLLIEDGCRAVAVPDTRKRWVTYGSSLTHCVRAHSPARTWPAIVARRHNLNLTSLGFNGQCHLDAMVGLTIRDLSADFISLKMGINCRATLAPRTYPAAIVGLVRIIRERHPTTPIALVSPICSPPSETTKSVTGLCLTGMRDMMRDVYERLVATGDRNLWYFDGLDVLNEQEARQYAPEDLVHPNGDGIEAMARNFDRTVMQGIRF